ncbi:hypothetical protein BAE44_0023225, partial [Dichanthelium oligosanthes]
LPRILSGFFYQSISGGCFPARHFANVVSGDEGRRAPLVGPALSFQPGAERTSLVDCCSSLPAVSSHFHVLAFLEDESYYITGVEIYSSSQTGGWSRKESGWSGQTTLRGDARSVFFNGMLHLVVIEAAIVAIDV